MISTTFDKVAVKGQFVCNGTNWVKRSKRTASIFGQPNKWFYFSNKDRVSVAEKWLENKVVYIIEQFTGYQFEPIPEGDFDTEEEAIRAMQKLENDLGWSGLRVSVVGAGVAMAIHCKDEQDGEGRS